MKNKIILYLLLISFTNCERTDSEESSENNITVLEHFDSGELKRKYSLKSGRMNGRDSIFYRSGNLQATYQWYDSLLIHEGFEYYDKSSPMLVSIDGDTSIVNYPMIKIYRHFNSYGKVGFTVQYDSDLQVAGLDGDAIVSVYLDPTNFNATIFFAKPPLAKSRLIINASLEDTILIDTVTINETRFDYSLDKKEGKKLLEVVLNYTIYDTKTLYNESLILYRDPEKWKMKRL